jgi:outer membrane autotransporter protein
MKNKFRISSKFLTFSVLATILATSSLAFADTTYGVVNNSGSTMTITTATDQTVTASSGDATPAIAYGIYTDNYSPINIQGDLHIVAQATNTAGGEFHAYGAFTKSGELNINTTGYGASGLGKRVQIEGDLDSYWNNINAYLDTSDSYLKGTFKSTGIGNAYVTFANGATWMPVFDNRYGTFYNSYDPATSSPSYVDKGTGDAFQGGSTVATNLALNNGIVNLTWDNGQRTDARELSSYYKGHGTFIINTDITRNPGQGPISANADMLNLTVTDEDSSLVLKVNYDPGFTSGKSFNGVDGTGLVVVNNGTNPLTVTATGTAYNAKTFTPILKESVVQNTKTTATLRMASITPTPLTDPAPGAQAWYITGYTASQGIGYPPNVNVTTTADGHYALHNLWLDETSSLNKRMGELRDTETTSKAGMWARYNYNKLEAGSGDMATIKTNMFQLGYDKDKQGTRGTTYNGVAMSYAKGTSEFSKGDGNLKETTLSLYHTFIGNDGHYYDIVLKGGKFMNDFNIHGNNIIASDSDYSTWAYSLSGEYGKRTTWGDGLYVEPQAQLTLGHMNSADYTTSTGMKTKADATNMALVRLGVALGKKFNHGTLYAKANYFHDFGGGISITADDVNYSRDAAKNWGEFAIGGDIKAGKNCNIYGEVTKYVGQLKSPIGVNIGARWSF